MLLVWLALLIPASFVLFGEVIDASNNNTTIEPFLIALVSINALFISYFWLNGVKDLVYVAYYYFARKRFNRFITRNQRAKLPKKLPRVVLVYCTANDFNEQSLEKSMRQKYINFKTVILDDSNKPEYKSRVDAFAKLHNIRVIRRKDRLGFKAGNLNNYLRGRKDYDYFVILDSDEIVPSTFISSALRYFENNSNVGIVQANHVATRNRNKFMRIFAKGVDSHWPTYQMTKQHHGFMSLLGHGAMVSRDCYNAAGGFPHVVAEDLCFSIEARIKGYFVAFAQNIRCQEEYPVDYLAFKKRHSKWTQGNMEFIKTYTKRILTSNMTWYEKLDIALFTYNLPLTAFFAFYIVINLIALPALGYSLSYPGWLLAPTIIFLLAPMLNDIIYHSKREKITSLINYLLNSFILYGSMFFISLLASTKSILGAKAIFHVTPKTSSDVAFFEAIFINWRELVFGASLIAIAMVTVGNILPVILIAVPSILSVYLTMLSNKPGRIHTAKEKTPLFGKLSTQFSSWFL